MGIEGRRGSVSEVDGFPVLSPTESALRLADVTAVHPPIEVVVRHDIPRSPTIALVGLASVAVCAAIHLPVLGSEPLFVLINAAVTCVMITVGTYLAVSEQERFTGIAFVLAGAFYPVNDLDIYSGWGAYLSYVFGGGALFYGSLAWGILRYGRDHLEHRSERVFIPVSMVLTSGSGLLAT